MADGKPLRETLSDEFEEDDISQGGQMNGRIVPQDLIDSVMTKGLDWFKAQVASSNTIKSTPKLHSIDTSRKTFCARRLIVSVHR